MINLKKNIYIYHVLPRLAFSIAFSLLILSCFSASDKDVDSLKTVLRSSLSPQQRYLVYKKLVFLYSDDRNLDSAAVYLDKLKRSFSKLDARGHKETGDLHFAHAAYFSKSSRPDSALLRAKEAKKHYKLSDNVKSVLETNFVIERTYIGTGAFDSCVKLSKESISLAEELKDKLEQCIHWFTLAVALGNTGKRTEARDAYENAIRIAHEGKLYDQEINSLINLSYFYNDIDTKLSRKYLSRAEKLLDKSIDPVQRITCMAGWGNLFSYTGQTDSAIYVFRKVLPELDSVNDRSFYSSVIANLGDLYYQSGDYENAIAFTKRSIALYERDNNLFDLAICYGSLGDSYFLLQDYKRSILNYQKAIDLSLELKLPDQLIQNYSHLSECYEKLGDYKNAYKNFKLFKSWNDTLNNIDNAKKLTEKELNFQFELQQKEKDLIQKNKDELTQEQIKRQKFTIYASVAGACVLLVFLFVSVRNSNIRKRINKQLEQSHTEIKQQKNIIETKNREITDSIMYASRIQQGILPDQGEIKSLLPGGFLFFRPRDIVSGDFYWVRALKGSDEIGYDDMVGVVVADCTGHGVPGAFMSFIGSTILNQTLGNNKIANPADALNYLNEQLPITLQSKIKTGQINDGMEAGIFTLNKKTNKLFFAGANLNLIHIRNGVVNEVRGDKHSIGLNIEQQKTFTNNALTLEKGDCIYMFSDGYPDQFGGEKGKKYKYKNLLNFLNEISVMSSEEQSRLLSENFDKWKGEHEQLDDVLLFGMKV
jgi:serine phosphatase RsbU (regulator of sigma subunit)/tetratricopeptide (TPR) repeat protein